MMKRYLSVLCVAFAIAACTKVGTQTSGVHNPGTIPGEVRIAIQSEPINLNPILASNTTDGMVDALMFDFLVTADPKGNPLPDLANPVPTLQNGGISKDGLTITYHLRKNVKWSDGAPFTSKDVKFSWQAVVNPQNNTTSRRGYDLVRSIDTPDPYTVVVHMKQRFAPIVNTLFAESDNPIWVVPEHILGKYPDINRVPFNNQPVGTGPYKLAEWVKGDHITVVRNDNYFLGRPKLDKIVVHVIPDENTTINELKTHDIDWMFQASPDTCKETKNLPGVNVFYNNVDGYESVLLNLKHPPLDNPLVRKAIAYAINKQELVDTLTCGTQKIATEDHPDFMWAHNPNVMVYNYDPQKAKQLLQQAGYSPGPNGMMQKNGKPISLLGVTNTTNVTRRQLSVLVQSQLRAVGIDMSIKNYPGAQLFAPAGEGGVLQLGKFDLSFSGWYAGVDPDDSSQFICSMVPPGGYNYTRYCKPEMDAAQQNALTHFDQPARQAAYYKIESLLADDVPQIFFWWVHAAQPINTDLKGFDPNPATETWNAYQWSI
ncbi:MAG: peptide ABC transporter substrate-binding protein [Candidatus Eremiobacteraeota bacterium]|nr:peptide ABC transporter substrate-binding protein [Candidatus Eremiobacteraeota bacterium]